MKTTNTARVPDDYSREARCVDCRLTPGLCVCDELPVLELPVRFILVQHYTERLRQSNTGRIVTRMLAGSRLLMHAAPSRKLDGSPLREANTDYYLLYPEVGAATLTPELIADRGESRRRGVTFVVLDATWRKARRMACRIPELRGMPRIALPVGAPIGTVLRRALAENQHYTLEAVTRAVETLGLSEATTLRAATGLIMRRLLHTRGRLPRGAVTE